MVDFVGLERKCRQPGSDRNSPCSLCGKDSRLSPTVVCTYATQIWTWILERWGQPNDDGHLVVNVNSRFLHFHEVRFCGPCITQLVRHATVGVVQEKHHHPWTSVIAYITGKPAHRVEVEFLGADVILTPNHDPCSVCGRGGDIAPVKVFVYNSQLTRWIADRWGRVDDEGHVRGIEPPIHFEEVRFCGICIADLVEKALTGDGELVL